MTTAAEVWLAIIAVAVTVLAIVQVGIVVTGIRLARRVEHMTTEIETGVKPLMTHLTALSSEAARAASLAAAQVERFDRVVADLSTKVEQTLTAAQHFVKGPAREGMAIVAGVRAAMTALQSMRESSRRRSAVRSVAMEEEEESLFIG